MASGIEVVMVSNLIVPVNKVTCSSRSGSTAMIRIWKLIIEDAQAIIIPDILDQLIGDWNIKICSMLIRGTAPTILSSGTYLCLRFVSKGYGRRVEWTRGNLTRSGLNWRIIPDHCTWETKRLILSLQYSWHMECWPRWKVLWNTQLRHTKPDFLKKAITIYFW